MGEEKNFDWEGKGEGDGDGEGEGEGDKDATLPRWFCPGRCKQVASTVA